MTSGGYGSGPYGVVPYGGTTVATSTAFDIFCFADVSMLSVLTDPNVTTEGDGGHFHPNPISAELDLLAGGTEPLDDGRVIITANIPDVFTVEWVLNFAALPNDFTDIVHQHVYAGVSDAAGAVLGLLFSKVGVAYTGSVSFPVDPTDGLPAMQLDCTLQVLPGSSSYISENEYYVVRTAADYNLGIVYLYMTRLLDLPVTGHQLRAVLPVIPFYSAAHSPTDESLISVRGTLLHPVQVSVNTWCAATSLIIPNLIPVADAGMDQAVRSCSIVMLDGGASFDPEGASLAYSWRFIEGPDTSSFVVVGHDGFTTPLPAPTGYTDKFHSSELADVDALDPILIGTDGDVLLARGLAYTLVGKGIDGDGFYVQTAAEVIPDDYASDPFKVLRQRGLKDFDTVHPTFFPDKPGFYKFDLTVNDGALYGGPSIVLVNVVESVLPRGCTPDLSFIFEHLSDFWGLVEDKDRISTFWSALAQVASTEMFTLWQLEYSKSLRDIQRYFNRRWLHYDLLLPEPLPELTSLRVMYGGVQSAPISTAGANLHGLQVVVVSEVMAAPVTLVITAPNPVTPTALATELQWLLQEYAGVDFTTHVVEDRLAALELVRIDAPVPFSIGPLTTLPFTVGDENRHPSGSSGAGAGVNGYKVDRSLEGLGIVEDDLLSVNGVSYRIASVQDNPTDEFPFQRLVLKEFLPENVSTTWAIGSWVRSEFLDFYGGLVALGDYVDFEVSTVLTVDSTTTGLKNLVEGRVLGANAALSNYVAVDAWDVGVYAAQPEAYTTYLARAIRRSYAPVDELVADIPTLQQLIVMEDDEATLRRNVDYFIEDVRGRKAVRFVAGAGADPDVWEGARPPYRLWAEYTYLDNRPLIEANFGAAIGFSLDQLDELPGNVDYLSAVRGLWYSFYNGPTVANMRIGAQILLGLPFAEEDSYIEEIRTDFSPKYGRILLRDKVNAQIIRSYSFPSVLLMETNPATGARYVAGDFVQQFASLVEGVEILDYVKDPLWFQGYLNQGVFYEVEKYYRFAVRVDSAAFNLNALLFVKNFVNRAKPQYTYPLVIVRYQVKETEVSTTDQRSSSIKLSLYDSPNSALLGSSFLLDEPRSAYGGVRNRLDVGPDPTHFPAFGVPEVPTWGLDRNYYLVPTEEMLIITEATYAAPFTPTLDSIFILDQDAGTALRYEDVAPGIIPAGPVGFALTPVLLGVLPADGSLASIRFIALGDPGADPTDYEVVVSIDGVDVATQAFTAGVNTEVVVTPAGSGSAGDTVGVRVRLASAGGARSPNWSKVMAYVRVDEGAWALDDILDAGVYCSEHTS
jgi:hypothetical protein